jgi:hypothetical protein
VSWLTAFAPDLTPPEVPIPIGGGLDVRLSALHLSGPPITQLSTSRLFALITQWGAAPLGLEWVNDSSCVVVFANAIAALSALQLVSRPSYTPAYPIPEARLVEAAARVQQQHERSEPVEDEIPNEFVLALLTPRRTRAVPVKLYTPAERDALAAARAPAPQEELPEDAPAIYAEMQAEEAALRAAEPAQVALRALRAPLFARFALDSADNKRSQAASSSKWYAQHGKGAGKDVVPRLLEVREKKARGRGLAGGAMMDDMDRELDEMRVKREQEEKMGISAEPAPAQDQWRHDRFEGVKREDGGRQRGRRAQPRGGLDALDEELEEFRSDRARSASPVRPTNNGQIRIRGRGAMRSALAWADEDEVARSSSSKKARGLEARLGAGKLADRFADNLESRFS